MPNFYQLLCVDTTASPEEIKRAFRQEIARYHPDKVQHLGKEFQEMAATRAAQLTEAYRTLMDATLRADYDRALTSEGFNQEASSSAAPQPPQPPATAAPSATEGSAAPGTSTAAPAGDQPARFSFERATRDEFVRKATMGRLWKALEAEFGPIDEMLMKGFDVSYAVKSKKKLFARSTGPRLVAKFVDLVDRAAVREAWGLAQKADGVGEICIFLMGGRLAPERELAAALAEQRRRTSRAPRVSISLISIDIRDWKAYVPNDAPAPCKSVVQRLRTIG